MCGRTEPSGAAGRRVRTVAWPSSPALTSGTRRRPSGSSARRPTASAGWTWWSATRAASPAAAAATASPRLHAKIIELNLIAPLHVAQAANAVMQDQPDGGSIIMIGSVSGIRPSPGTAAYGAAKAGLHHLATSLAVEWAPKVRVNSVVAGPGSDRAAAAAHYRDAAGRRRWRATVPLGRLATPGDVAAPACSWPPRWRLIQRRRPAGARRRRAARVPGRRLLAAAQGAMSLAMTRTCSTKGLAMVASIKPHRDELGLADGLMLIDGAWRAARDGKTWHHSSSGDGGAGRLVPGRRARRRGPGGARGAPGLRRGTVAEPGPVSGSGCCAGSPTRSVSMATSC